MQTGALVAAATVGCLVFVAGAVAIADPGADPAPPPAVDAGAAPAELARATLAQTQHRGYAVTIRSSYTGPREIRTLDYRIRVESADRQVIIRGLDRPFVLYGNAHRTWRAEATDPGPGDWEATGAGWDGSPVVEPVELGGDVSIVSRNASAVVVRLNDTATVHRLVFGASPPEPDTEAFARLTVDRSVGAPRQLIVVSATPADDPDAERTRRRTVLTFSNWDETAVERPASLPFSFAELVRDASRVDDGGRP